MSTLHTYRGSCLFLLIISQITCDWVEIEQDNYKPHRKLAISTGYKDHKTQVVPEYEDTTKENKLYRNNSVGQLWSKGMVDRVSNVGNIKRVQMPSVKTTAIKVKQENIEFSKTPAMEKISDTLKYRERTNIPQRHYFTDPPNIILKLKNNEDEEFQDQGQRQEYDKTTNTGIKLTSSFKSSVNNFQNDKNGGEQEDFVNINAPNKVKQTQTLHKNENNKIHLNDETDNYYNSNYQRIQIGRRRTSPRPNIFNSEELTTKKIKIINKSQTTENYNVQNSDQLDDIKYTNYSRPFDEYITKISNANENPNNFKKPSLNRPMAFETMNSMNSDPAVHVLVEGEGSLASATEEMHADSEDISKSKKKNTMDGMLKLMKVVSDTIYKNTHRSFKSKVKYLEGLKSTLLTTIEDHVDTLWPDDKHRTRHVREARGHLEFPSSESALMSISFLTFAVFLIKLVLRERSRGFRYLVILLGLICGAYCAAICQNGTITERQVLHTYKNKTMMVAPTVVAAVGRAARAIRNQH